MLYFLSLSETYTTKWWFITLRGFLAVLFGVTAMLNPHLAATVAVYLVSLGLMLDGLKIAATAARSNATWRLWQIALSRALVEIILGALALYNGYSTFKFMAFLFAFALIFRGVLEFVSFLEIESPIEGQRITLISAIGSMLIGLGLIITPLGDEFAFILFIGAYAIVEGCIQMASAGQISARLKEAEVVA
ncbi:MAG: DUF308 domain-containing protein [Chloroflexi bacterium]|nr:DUF308 domain-containing protein [Chloroflexota bacterium]